jgi:hypothetical protein
MNDLAFGATLLSLLVTLSAAFFSELNTAPFPSAAATTASVAQGTPTTWRGAGTGQTACACNGTPLRTHVR